MRAWVLVSLVLFAMPAAAQPALDGKATLSGAPGDVVAKGVTTKDQVRAVIVAAIGDRFSAEETDFFNELASGAAVNVVANGKASRVAPLTGEALALAKLVAAPPNLNTLWKARGEPMLQMIEVSRWGDTGKSRVIGFMGNNLYASWTRSDVRNAYSDWVSTFSAVNNSMSEIADPAVKTEAKLLLKAAMEQVFAKCKADGREPPALFLYDIAFLSVGQPQLP